MSPAQRFGARIVYFIIGLLVFTSICQGAEWTGKADNTPDWFYPEWAATAPYNHPVKVRDTDSALGRYSLQTKEVGLEGRGANSWPYV